MAKGFLRFTSIYEGLDINEYHDMDAERGWKITENKAYLGNRGSPVERISLMTITY